MASQSRAWHGEALEPEQEEWLADALDALAQTIESRQGFGNGWPDIPQSMMLGIGIEVHRQRIVQTDLIWQELGRLLRRNGKLRESMILTCEKLLRQSISVVPGYLDYGERGHARLVHAMGRVESE